MASSFTVNKNIEKPAYNDYASNPTGWSGPINSDWDIIDRSLGGTQVLTPSATTLVTLTTSQYQAPILVIGSSISGSATLTNAVNYRFPSGVGGVWQVYNNTTGAYTITFSSAGGGTSTVLPQGTISIIYSDGTNVRASYAASSTIAGGSNTQVQYNSSGALGASANFTYAAERLIISGAGSHAIEVRKGGPLNLYRTADDAAVQLYCNTDGEFAIAGKVTADNTIWAKAGGIKFPDNTLQTTAAVVSTFPAIVGNSQTLPSGLILKWGQATVGANTSLTVNYGTAFPTSILNLQVTQTLGFNYSGGPYALGVDATTSNFTVYNNNTGLYGFYWYAVGT